MEECQILRSIGSHAVAYYCNTFPDIMLTGPRVMDIDTKICTRNSSAYEIANVNFLRRHLKYALRPGSYGIR